MCFNIATHSPVMNSRNVRKAIEHSFVARFLGAFHWKIPCCSHGEAPQSIWRLVVANIESFKPIENYANMKINPLVGLTIFTTVVSKSFPFRDTVPCSPMK